jgi:voltage-gated sodium channel
VSPDTASSPEAAGSGPIAATCARIADSGRFQGFIFAVIVANAVALGLETYPAIEADAGELLNVLDAIFLGIFVIELAIRITAYGRRPQDFFRDGWNVFDFVVIGAAFLPGLRQNATLLRIVRLLRVVRLASVLPDLRIVVAAMTRSLAPIASLVVLTLLLMFVYGMVGWILFHEEDPGNWGNIGDAMLNLFIVSTLEDWPQLLRAGMEIHPASWIFFVSYVLIASFLVINILIAIIVNSMEEVREAERRAGRGPGPGLAPGHELLSEREQTAVDAIRALREDLEQLEHEILGGKGGAPPARPETSS